MRGRAGHGHGRPSAEGVPAPLPRSHCHDHGLQYPQNWGLNLLLGVALTARCVTHGRGGWVCTLGFVWVTSDFSLLVGLEY